MNTLLSMISWIELNPPKAKKLIQALADEFRLINKISAQKEIRLAEEIDLCWTHLQLMGYQLDASYKLDSENLPLNASVPPMIFHTLIENGLTHSFQTGENGNFKISCTSELSRIVYRIQNNGSLLKKVAIADQQKYPEGLGLKYIKARLEESYPGKWELNYGENSNGWETTLLVVVRRNSRKKQWQSEK